MTQQRLTVMVDQNENGEWVFVDNGGNVLQEYRFDSKADAQKAAKEIWPSNSVWHGREVKDGWSIVI
jgi:hypothetical protein